MRVIKWEPFRDVDDIFDRFFAETLRRWPRVGTDARPSYDWAPVADVSETLIAWIVRQARSRSAVTRPTAPDYLAMIEGPNMTRPAIEPSPG